MEFIYSTGGREKYFDTKKVGDCVTRAICNATGKDYLEVYNRLKYLEKTRKIGKHEKKGSVRDGVRVSVYKYYIEQELGWIHIPTVKYQQGTSVHLVDGEIPMGNLIVDLSKHLTNVKDGVIYDTYNCSSKMYRDRFTGEMVVNNNRAVYNMWRAPTPEEVKQKEENKKMIQEMIELEKAHIEKTKQKVKSIKDKYEPKLSKLTKQLKNIQHQLVIETNRMNKEIDKVKKQSGDAWRRNDDRHCWRRWDLAVYMCL